MRHLKTHSDTYGIFIGTTRELARSTGWWSAPNAWLTVLEDMGISIAVLIKIGVSRGKRPDAGDTVRNILFMNSMLQK